MTSNSKLTREQKAALKGFKILMRKNMAFGHSGGVTVLVEVNKNVVRFSTSVASPDEQKIRKKVGQYHAMERWDNGETAIMPTDRFDTGYSTIDDMTPQDVAGFVAELLQA